MEGLKVYGLSEEPDFDANKYLNKTMINLFEDED